MTNRELFVSHALQWLNIPYRWGGDDPSLGIDCSGLAQELLKPFGFKLQDQTAHDLYLWCFTSGFQKIRETGALVFYGSHLKVTHVGVLLTDKVMIEAGGGGSDILTLSQAQAKNAFTRLRPFDQRKDLVQVYLPPFNW